MEDYFQKIFLTGLMTLLFATPAYADWIRLGTWNIEKLGVANDDSAPIALAEHIFITGLDAISFQEIYDNDGVGNTRTNTQLDVTFEILNRVSGQNWKYEMLENKSSGDKSQLVALAWNTNRLKKVGETLRLDIDRSNDPKAWDRHPSAIKLSAGDGKTDIVIVGVHMKADFRGDFSARRAREAELLLDNLPIIQSTFNDKDVVFLGDFNCGSHSEPAIQAFMNKGFRDMNWRDTGTHVKYGPLDRIIVPDSPEDGAGSEFYFSRQYILTAADSKLFDQFLSDHRLSVTPIRIRDDDD